MGTARHRARRIAKGFGLVVVVDLTTKLAATTLAAGHTAGPVVPVRNPEFSLGIAAAPPLTTLAVAALGIAAAAALIVGPALRGQIGTWIPACLLGGAIANLIDQIAFGSVHDFLATPWIVFNLADIAVLVGVAGLVASRPQTPHKEANPWTPSVAPH